MIGHRSWGKIAKGSRECQRMPNQLLHSVMHGKWRGRTGRHYWKWQEILLAYEKRMEYEAFAPINGCSSVNNQFEFIWVDIRRYHEPNPWLKRLNNVSRTIEKDDTYT